MTVAELIAELQKYGPQTRVVLPTEDEAVYTEVYDVFNKAAIRHYLYTHKFVSSSAGIGEAVVVIA